MALGNKIVVSSDANGKRIEGIIGAGLTPKPGTVMQIDFSVAKKGGRYTWKLFNRGADGKRPAGPLIVLREDELQGKTMTDAYAAGDRALGYVPLAGEELNMLVGDVAGTADDHTIGEILMVDDTTGKLVATTGSPETGPFVLGETITDPVADTLALVIYSGY